jgi:hypothetical protein
MRRAFWVLIVVALVAAVWLAQSNKPAESAEAKPDFAITASYIESCSCDMFCPCYFNDHATMHGETHFCKFNNVLRVDEGYYKEVDLAGVKTWLSGDLGSQWSQGKADWLVVTFDSAVSETQQAAMKDILLQLYPVEWNILGVDTVPFTWWVEGDTAHARMENRMGEVILHRFAANNNDAKQEVVVDNLKYWTSQSNTGFRMWKNERNYYEGHGQKFETNGTNGFLITINFSGQATEAAAGD